MILLLLLLLCNLIRLHVASIASARLVLLRSHIYISWLGLGTSYPKGETLKLQSSAGSSSNMDPKSLNRGRINNKVDVITVHLTDKGAIAACFGHQPNLSIKFCLDH